MHVEDPGLEPRISCQLAIVGHALNPARISQLLGVEPTTTSLQRPIKIGPDKGKGAWYLKTGPMCTIDLNAVIEGLFSMLTPELRRVSEALRNDGLEVSVEASVEVRSTRRPLILLSSAVVQRLADIGAEFTIDWFDPCDFGQT